MQCVCVCVCDIDTRQVSCGRFGYSSRLYNTCNSYQYCCIIANGLELMSEPKL